MYFRLRNMVKTACRELFIELFDNFELLHTNKIKNGRCEL